MRAEFSSKRRSFIAVTALSCLVTSAGQYALYARTPPPHPVVIVDPIDMTHYAASAYFCADRVEGWVEMFHMKAPRAFIKRELNRCYAAELPRV